MNKIIQGDCLEVMKTMEDNSIDMVLTSPPYDNLRTYNGSLDWGEHIWKPIIQELYRIVKDGGVVVWVVGDATINGSETGTSFKQALYFKEIGFNLHDTMIWEKESFSNPFPNRYHQVFEYMFVFSKGSLSTFNPIVDRKNKNSGKIVGSTVRESDGTLTPRSKKLIADYGKRFNIWKLTVQKQKGENVHPAPFPEQLAHDHIIS